MYRNLVGHCNRINVARCLFGSGKSSSSLSEQQRCSITTKLICHKAAETETTASYSSPHSLRPFHSSTAVKMTTPGAPTEPAPTQHTNRLASERSTYLLQHAHNPVDWYPWGDEAIQRARTENKLIFLSVGYSTCHWCHVMEKECFENAEIAKQMNQDFICIKVDREERPDLDRIYMNFVVLVSQSGGWPMSVWLTPELAPIAGGTYFPPVDRWGTPGFPNVLRQMQTKWSNDRVNLLRLGQRVIERMQLTANSGGGLPDGEDEAEAAAAAVRSEISMQTVEDRFAEATHTYMRSSDSKWGGFRQAPKFPEVSKIAFVLQGNAHRPDGDGKLLSMALHTLHRIAEGGIHDHVFGGFARYAVDRKWHVPHFEKMLYDQGQLMQAYATAYQITGDRLFADVADGIFRYVCKDLQHPEGGFYSGEDADSLPELGDSVKIEGAFYAWDWNELCDVYTENIDELGALCGKAFELYTAYYGCEEGGNVEADSDPHGHLLSKNILMVQMTQAEAASKFDCDEATVARLLSRFNELLHAVRERRPRPHLDTKIITAWNGLMLSGLAKLACVGGDAIEADKRGKYAKAAEKLVTFLRTNVYDETNKTLYRTCYGEGVDSGAKATLSVPIAGFLDDYAFLIRGLLDYHLMSGDVIALRWARDLQATQDRLFWDNTNDAYFFSEENSRNVVVRLKDDHDGAEPCGNSIAVGNLVRLHGYFGDEVYRTKAAKVFAFYAPTREFGMVLPEMLCAWMLHDMGLCEVVVVGKAADETVNSFLATTRGYFIPGLTVTHFDPDADAEACANPAAHAEHKLVDEKPSVYVCHNQACLPPITSLVDLRKQFEKYLRTTK